MAKATAEKTVTSVTLELSADEAEALAALFGRIGGDPRTSPRKHTDSISRALASAGFVWTDEKNKARKLMSGDGLRFSPYTSREVF